MKDDPELDQFSDQEIVAKTIYGEARGETHQGRIAVCNVIFNRAKTPRWWGTSPRACCLHPYQFSCWNEGDPNRVKIIAVTDEDPIYAECLGIAKVAFANDLPDVTGGADSYKVIGTLANWSKELTPCKIIGAHEFFKTI